MNKEQMSIEDVEDCAKQIVEEAIVFNKIPMQQKNLWISKILDHIALKEDKQQQLPEKERLFFNTWQHMKIMDEVKSLNTGNGIGSLLEIITKVDNSRVNRIAEKTHQPVHQIDYAGIWDKSNAKQKLTFFKDHDESKCPTGTKWIARDYYRKLGLNVEELMVW
jgi:hypothetical protein|tara:strand:+ start:414 stop:905 length:492 start_codon:yes stop_codon:yes gene_type:complete